MIIHFPHQENLLSQLQRTPLIRTFSLKEKVLEAVAKVFADKALTENRVRILAEDTIKTIYQSLPPKKHVLLTLQVINALHQCKI